METNKVSKKLYNGTVEIVFYPDSHRYKIAGEKTYLTSVTAVTSQLDKSRFLIPWATGLARDHLLEKIELGQSITREDVLEACDRHTKAKEEAASIGSVVHTFAEAWGRGDTSGELPDPLDERVVAGITAFLDFVTTHSVKFLECERMVYSKTFGYVGLTDAIVEIDGKRYLVDYKTSKGLYDEYNWQVAAYLAAYQEETGEKLDGAIVIHFSKDSGEMTPVFLTPQQLREGFDIFISLLGLKQKLKLVTK